MKFRFLIFVCSLALIYSCSKNDDAQMEPPPPPPSYSGTPDDSVIVFPDATLDLLIREYIHKETGSILYGDIKKLDTINGFNRANIGYVKNLQGIQFCSNLKAIGLAIQDVDNLTVFKNLNSLSSLDLVAPEYPGTKFIKDLTPLQNLYLLKYVRFYQNNIADISPLVSSSAQLKYLTIRVSSQLTLKNIDKLVNLEFLDLTSTNTTDIANLQYLKNLNTLYLTDNHIQDITPLKNLVQMKELSLDQNKVTDITALENLIQIENLYLPRNNVNDIGPLSKLTKVNRLILQENHITNLNALQNLNQLKTLILFQNDILDITPLIDGVPALEGLIITSQSPGTISKTQKDAFIANHPNAYHYWDD